jgi:radical SAM superfamily enzyme YgiQ (UPF0313 family)
MMFDQSTILRDETKVRDIPAVGRLRVAVGYPNTYFVAMSSLAFQWVVEQTAAFADVGVERFFTDPPLLGRTLENGSHLGDFDVLAWTLSFELDAPNILATLDAAGIPRRAGDRDHTHPLVVVGGAVASINALPLSPAVDVFVLGSAELLWPRFLEILRAGTDRGRLLEELAELDGFFVPSLHLDTRGVPLGKRRRVEKRDAHMADHAMVPASHVVTPHTEYSGRGLIEMSRGCPEKCRYCWVSYNYGRLRSYSTEGIMDRVDRLSTITNRIGFVATAVGDHPDLAEILDACRRRGLEVALSSLRIPAMRREILEPLAASGARSVTIAPETGTDRLRTSLNKPISNESILEAVSTAQACGIESIKMYFIIGLPGETDDDLRGIADLLRKAQALMVAHGRARGRVGSLLAGFNVLVPKPYTPYAREAMVTRQEARRKMEIVERAAAGISNLQIDRPSYRLAQWQTFLSRGDVSVYGALESAASGLALGARLASHREGVDDTTLHPVEGSPVWQFVVSAPVTR